MNYYLVFLAIADLTIILLGTFYILLAFPLVLQVVGFNHLHLYEVEITLR